VGTPSDCVVLALQVILDRPPDLIVAGINHGPNMGEDVTYSGTVAVAFEGTILGVPSVAISALQRSVADEEVNGRVARRVAERALEYGVPAGALLNVNIPNPDVAPVKGLRFTKLGSRHYENFIEPVSVGQKTQYTIGGRDPVWREDDGTDIAAVRMGFVSITPLHLDLTHYKAIVEMERWRFEL
jgi:5'-nucleotidase